MNAKDLQRGDDFVMKLSCRVLSVEPISGTHVKVRVAIEDQPSIFIAGQDENPIEFVCRNSRYFSPWRRHGGGGGKRKEPVEPPPSPKSMEPVA
jgi:hypothetical protein